MALPNPFRRRDANTRTAYGYTFQLTEDHLTREEMEPMKYSYDLLGEQAWERLNIISPPPNSALPRNSPSRHSSTDGEKTAIASGESFESKRDLYQLLCDNADKDEILGKLWEEVNTVPSWVDWEQLARGQDVFYRYGGPILTGLAFQSLLGGMVGHLTCLCTVAKLIVMILGSRKSCRNPSPYRFATSQSLHCGESEPSIILYRWLLHKSRQT